jgi:transcriptional regulator with XRE-family HTH domain
MVRKQIADNIKKYSERKGWNQNRLADETGIKQSTLSGYFTATSTPSPGQIQKIALALGVGVDDIDPIRLGNNTKKEPTVIDSRLQEMIDDFKSLSEEDQQAVLHLVASLSKKSRTS